MPPSADPDLNSGAVVAMRSGRVVEERAVGVTCWGSAYTGDTLAPSLCSSKPWLALAILDDLRDAVDDDLGPLAEPFAGITMSLLLSHNAGLAGLPATLARVLPDALKRESAARPERETTGPSYTEFSGFATAARCWEALRGEADFRDLLDDRWPDHPWRTARLTTDAEVAVPSLRIGDRYLPALGEGGARARLSWNPGFGGVVSASMLAGIGGSVLDALHERRSLISSGAAQRAITTIAWTPHDPVLRGPAGFTTGLLSSLSSDWFGTDLSPAAVGICGAGGTTFLVIDPEHDLSVGGVFRYGIDERSAGRRSRLIDHVLATAPSD